MKNIGEQITITYIWPENRVFSTLRKVHEEGTFGNDSNFASWLLGLENRRRREQ